MVIYVDSVEEEGARLYSRRSTDSGATWEPAQWLGSTYGGFSAIAGSGTDVDVAWWEAYDFSASTLHYRHSSDGGATFSAPIDIATGDYGWVSIARRGDVVAIVWEHVEGGSVTRASVSTDGGTSFASSTSLGAAAHYAVVAVGEGVIYIAYFVDTTHVNVRRSLDNGTTWASAIELAADATNAANFAALSLTAAASHAYLAYAAKSGESEWVRYTRTIDKGATWTTPADLSSPSGHRSLLPLIHLKAGVVRVIYEECLVGTCNRSFVAYRESSDGITWTPAETASLSSPRRWANPGGVGYAGGVIVLYLAAHGRDAYVCACDAYVTTK